MLSHMGLHICKSTQVQAYTNSHTDTHTHTHMCVRWHTHKHRSPPKSPVMEHLLEPWWDNLQAQLLEHPWSSSWQPGLHWLWIHIPCRWPALAETVNKAPLFDSTASWKWATGYTLPKHVTMSTQGINLKARCTKNYWQHEHLQFTCHVNTRQEIYGPCKQSWRNPVWGGKSDRVAKFTAQVNKTSEQIKYLWTKQDTLQAKCLQNRKQAMSIK